MPRSSHVLHHSQGTSCLSWSIALYARVLEVGCSRFDSIILLYMLLLHFVWSWLFWKISITFSLQLRIRYINTRFEATKLNFNNSSEYLLNYEYVDLHGHLSKLFQGWCFLVYSDMNEYYFYIKKYASLRWGSSFTSSFVRGSKCYGNIYSFIYLFIVKLLLYPVDFEFHWPWPFDDLHLRSTVFLRLFIYLAWPPRK